MTAIDRLHESCVKRFNSLTKEQQSQFWEFAKRETSLELMLKLKLRSYIENRHIHVFDSLLEQWSADHG